MREYDDFYALSDKFYRVLSKFLVSEKVPRSFGLKEKLYPSEIHMLDAIGNNSGINVTDLAAYLGITKGAVPKMVRKLKTKGLIESFQNADNAKEVYHRLTVKGKKAQDGYKEFHKRRNSFLKKYYKTLDKGEIELIANILDEIDRFADKLLED